jgi:uncharacterized membrane protein YphA (DoxX/SURF4 family)
MNGAALAFDLLATLWRFAGSDEVTSAARCAIGIVFFWSGSTKVARPALPAAALVHFGLARRVRPGLGLSVGVLELLLAAGLIAGFAPALAAAAVVLIGFVALLARQLIRHDQRPCYCFGTDEPVTVQSLGRTAGLALVALVVLVHPTPGVAPLSGIGLTALVGGAAGIGAAVTLGALSRSLRLASEVRA